MQKSKYLIQGNHECVVCHRIYVQASGLTRHMETQHNTVGTKEKFTYQSCVEEKTMAEVIKCLVCLTWNSVLMAVNTAYKRAIQCCTKKMTVDQVIQCEFCDLLFADSGLVSA